MLRRFLISLSLVGLLTGCAASKPDSAPEPVETLYNRAATLLEESRFAKAATAFETVDQQYPYSVWATRAQIMIAYAYYRAGAYDDALLALERFLSLHPGYEDAPYAAYLRAIVNYNRIADIERDQKVTEQALEGLREVTRRWPDTPYARDAALKIDLALDHLAGREMTVGRFYQQRRLYVAAIQRFQRVVTDYQTTSQTPEALHRLVECWLALGVTEEALRAAAVLGHNFPVTPWYRESYALLKGRIASSSQ